MYINIKYKIYIGDKRIDSVFFMCTYCINKARYSVMSIISLIEISVDISKYIYYISHLIPLSNN